MCIRDRAKECLIEALKMDQYIDDVYYLLGICYAREGNYSNAISSLIKAIRLDDRREEYYAELAYCYEKTKQFGKADFYYNKSTETGPEEETYWLAHVKFLMRRNKFEKMCIRDRQKTNLIANCYAKSRSIESPDTSTSNRIAV